MVNESIDPDLRESLRILKEFICCPEGDGECSDCKKARSLLRKHGFLPKREALEDMQLLRDRAIALRKAAKNV